MADSKAKKSTVAPKKIDDVKKGGDAASGTSRQVIVSNRPIARDPMMAQISELTGGLASDPASTNLDSDKAKPPEDKTASGAPEIIPNKKPAPQPIESKETEAAEATTPAIAPSKKKIVIQPLTEQPAATAEAPPVPDDKLAGGDIGSAKSDTVGADAKSSPKLETTDIQTEKKPTAENSIGALDSAELADKLPKQDADDAADKETSPAGTVQPGRSFDDVDTATRPAETATPEEIGLDEKGKAKKPTHTGGQLTPQQQKSVENEEYFLPITTSETRRLRREIAAAVILVLIMIVVWVDIMLDAGLLKLGGIHSITNFF